MDRHWSDLLYVCVSTRGFADRQSDSNFVMVMSLFISHHSWLCSHLDQLTWQNTMSRWLLYRRITKEALDHWMVFFAVGDFLEETKWDIQYCVWLWAVNEIVCVCVCVLWIIGSPIFYSRLEWDHEAKYWQASIAVDTLRAIHPTLSSTARYCTASSASVIALTEA